MSSDENDEGSGSDGFETLYVHVGNRASFGNAESALRDVAAFDTLDQDLTREPQDGGSQGSDEDEDDNRPMFGESKKKKKKSKKKKQLNQNNNGGDGNEDEDQERDPGELVEFFDFRRGPKHWPRGVELLSEEKAKELIDQALEEANKKQDVSKRSAGGKTSSSSSKFDRELGEGDDGFGKKDLEEGEDAEGKNKEAGGGDGKMMMGPMPNFYSVQQSSEEDEPLDYDEELMDPNAVLLAKQNPAPAEAQFEYLRDRSTALVIQPGTRLKLDVSGLTHDGLEKKAKAERQRYREALMSEGARAKAEKKRLDKKKRQSLYSFYDFDASGWDKDLWGVGLKNYVNEYTITFDLKLKTEPSRDGLSLFQTSLVYTEENPASGRKTTKQSDGECVVGGNCGVGIFGQFGDVVRAKLDCESWKRVVVSVRNVTEGKGEMRTWIDSVPCAVVKRDAFAVDGRFAVDGESLYLFSSQKPGMMPGGVLLRTVRVQHGASTDETVKMQHAKDKVISMFEIERLEKAEEERRGLALARLFPKPRPMWTASSIVGAIGDPFIEQTVYEGSSVLSWSYKVLHFALRNLVNDQESKFLFGLDHSARQVLSDVLLVMHNSSGAMNQMLRLLMHPNDSQVMTYLTKLRKMLTAMQVGESLLLPVMIEGVELLLIVERTTEQMFRFVVVDTDPERGLAHHPVNPSLGPKLRYRTCLVLSNIPKKNALDNVFWMAVYALAIRSGGEGNLLRFYDVLLPFLTGKPLETSLWEAEEQALKQEEDGVKGGEEVDFGVIGDWNSPQRSSTSYVRTLLHALRYMMASRGMSKALCKQVMFALRAQLVKMMDNDLQFVHPDDNGQRVCEMACSQLSYSACKLVNTYFDSDSGNEVGRVLLEEVKRLTDSVSAKLTACQDVEVELPPQLDLRDRMDVAPLNAAATAKGDNGEEEEEPIQPEDKSGEVMELTIKHGPSGSTKLALHTTSLVAHLLLRVERELHVLVHEQKLIYMGRLLHANPSHTLLECGLQSGAAIQLMETNVTAPSKPAAGAQQQQETAKERMRKIRAALRTDDVNAPAMHTQFMDSLAWDAEQQEPNPGAAISLRKYVPIDVLQMPSRVSTRAEAVAAIRLCDRLATLLDNQPHCVKNDRFLISSLITYTFTQLVPVPKPRAVSVQNGGEHDPAQRLERRRQRQQAKRELKQKPLTAVAVAAAPVTVAPITTASDQHQQPDFAKGTQFEQEMLKETCMWDQDIKYELQVELLLVLQRLVEHFVASVFSIQQDRPFDGVGIVTLGCITALSDAIMRRRAVDLPSEACSHLMGQTRDGRQLGTPGYGLSPATFATQTETIEVHCPEICLARTRVLDYFNSPQQRRLEKIFNWERHYELKPDRELIKYLRAVQREIANSDPNPHLLLVDGSPVEGSLLKRNYPELRCYRDICFYWKCLMNPDIKSLPNWVDVKRDGGGSGTLPRFGRLAAQLHWGFEQSQTTAGYLVWCQFQGIVLKCRPEPDRDAKGETFSKERQPPTHRFPSTATPSFYVTDLPAIRTEDDVIYRPNLPGFEDDPDPRKKLKALPPRGGGGGGRKKKTAVPTNTPRQQVLGQHDSELLISYLTVPYLRLPLVLTFFATDDRLHKLTSHKLRGILDSVLFEPGRYLALDLVGVAPTMVPTPHVGLLATPFGLLLNELTRSPNTVLQALDALLEGALALDTGSVCDIGEDDFNVSVDIILYVARLGARCESFVSLLIELREGEHECLSAQDTYRDLEVTPDCLEKLKQGRQMLRRRLLVDFDELFEDYLRRLDSETKRDPSNERLIDRNSRLAADLHAIKILFHRNTKPEEYTDVTARALIGSFVFLTTRHTWNKAMRSTGRILVPETELYEVLQIQRRRLIYYCRSLQQGPLDAILQSALQISTSTTGSLRANAEVVDQYNRWARISGDRSVGRFAVGSTRTVADESTAVATTTGTGDKPVKLSRQRSYTQEVGEVPDSGMLGVEMDLQIGQMTLRSKHLSALPGDIANHPDVRAVFGTATMQASLVERATNRSVYRLVGLNHDLENWHVPFGECPPIPDAFEREYNPSELFDSESWIPPLFEPLRKSFFDGPQPPPMQFMMLERPLPEHAEVAVLVGVHQVLGGAFKLVYLFRKLRVVHVYQAVSHARVFWWTLHLSTDVRYCFRELQPSFSSRSQPPPSWWKYGAGDPYPPNDQLSKHLHDDIYDQGGRNHLLERSVLIRRDAQHVDNLSNGKETLIPTRFLLGLVPHCLLEAYRFWRDESRSTARGRLGYVRMLGYPLDEADEFMIQIELQAQKQVEICGGLPSRTVRVVRRLKSDVAKECDSRRRLAELLEQSGQLLVRNTKLLRAMKRKQRASREPNDEAGSSSEGEQDADGEEEEEGGKHRKKKNRQGGNDNEEEEEEDDRVDHSELFIGAVVEHCIRTNNWVECVVHHLYAEDPNVVDVELRGDVHSGVVLTQVAIRDLRKKRLADSGMRSDEEDDAPGLGQQQQQQSRLGQSQVQLQGSRRQQQQQLGGIPVRTALGSRRGQRLRTEGEGIWHWQGLSDSDDADWAEETSDEDEGDNEGRKNTPDEGEDAARAKKTSLSFVQIDQLGLLLQAVGGDGGVETCLDALKRMPPPLTPFTSVTRLARQLARFCASDNTPSLDHHLRFATTGNDHVLLNLLYAPKASRLYSLMKTLCRIENLSNICVWTKASNLATWLHSAEPQVGVPPIDLVELPRLKLSFTCRKDHGGETSVLVPVACLRRPVISNQPFSTWLVLDRANVEWHNALSQRYFLYPVHVSLSFLMSKGIDSGLYLLLLRFFHRDYLQVFRLADSIATDTAFSPAGLGIFHALALANDDFHPDAHACRLKISLVTMDSGVKLPWDLTLQMCRYVTKLSHVSAGCRISLEEELQLLESEGAIAYEPSSPAYRKQLHTPFVRAVVRNRQQALAGGSGNGLVSCYAPSRIPLSNWPNYVDNTVFGVVYEEMHEVRTAEEWEELLLLNE
ncbi:hypothetical protein BASA81_000972 [Batrachochytrium salamandrivorans]|nr:hypothetical protein BASA81_000972 [Batrachochytrium salamandrivorans]